MSRKIANLTDSNYRMFFTGNKKRKVVTALSVMQYIISIGLVIGTLTIHAQLKLTQKKGECYRNLIEIGSWKGGKLDVNTFAAELKNRPEIVSVTRAGGSLLFAWLQQIIVENKDGSESYYSSVQYMGEEDLLQTLNLQIHQGLAPREAMQKYDQPVYINRRYADILIPAGETLSANWSAGMTNPSKMFWPGIQNRHVQSAGLSATYISIRWKKKRCLP